MNALSPASPSNRICRRYPSIIPAALVGWLYYLAFVALGILFAALVCYHPWRGSVAHDFFEALAVAAALGPFNLLRYVGSTPDYGVFWPFALGVGLMTGMLSAPRLRKPWLVFPIEAVLFWAWSFIGFFHYMSGI